MAWLGSWAHRIKIDIDYTGSIGAAVTWFPIAIIIEAGVAGAGDKDVSCIFDELTADANRKKIAITKPDGVTELYVEIENWADATEDAVLHVSRDGWVINDDTWVWIYYDITHADNDAFVADLGARTEVYDGNFKMVHHMTGAAWGNLDDSTANNNDVTVEHGTPDYDQAALIANAVNFVAASSEYFEVADSASLDAMTAAGTWSVWIYPHALGLVYILDKYYEGAGNTRAWDLHLEAVSGDIIFYLSTNAGAGAVVIDSGTPPVINTWNLITVTFAADDKVRIYLNDALVHTSAAQGANIHTNAQNLYIAAQYTGLGGFYDGLIDENRISDIDRGSAGTSLAWIKAEYHSGLDDLLTYGDEENAPVGAGGGLTLAARLLLG